MRMGCAKSATTWPSTSTRTRRYGGLTAARAAPSDVAERGRAPSSGAGVDAAAPHAEVHVVDHDLAEVVHDQVDGADVPATTTRAAASGSSGMPRAAGEVVAGAEREEPDHVAASSWRRCSAATTACRLPSPPATTTWRPPRRCSTLSSSPGLEVAATSTSVSLAQHRQRARRGSVVVGLPGRRVGDQQEGFHVGGGYRAGARVAVALRTCSGTPRPGLSLFVARVARSPSVTAGRPVRGCQVPAIVIVGAQWGDEGKGKATDLLGSSRRLRGEVQRRQQRRPHRGHRRPELRPAPAAQRHPHPRLHPGDRQRRGRRPRGAVRGDRRPRRPRRRRPAGCVVSANAHVIPTTTAPWTRSPSASWAARRLGTTGRGIGPTYADKMNRVGIRVAGPLRREDPDPEGRGRPGAEEPDPGQDLQPSRGRASRRRSRSC